MPKYFKLPLFFLVVASLIGLVLRWQFLSPTAGLVYGNWLHGHSHIMFLGWIFNFLNLAFLYQAFGAGWRSPYRILFVINQFLVVAMLFAFPIQGYGSVTIPLSVLHTLITGVFSYYFLRDTRHLASDGSIWFARAAVIFFLISALGPFMLGPIMASGLGHSKWYHLAIYYYLHFQYNGLFFFGVISILIPLLIRRGYVVDKELLIRSGKLFFISCFPAYALSALWTQPTAWVYWIGFAAAIAQIVAGVQLVRAFRRDNSDFNMTDSFALLTATVVISLFLKLVMQAVSAHPYFAQLAYENRYLVIGYLHLVLIGVVSLPVLVWYSEMQLVYRPNRFWVACIVVGFVAGEVIMFSIPFASGSSSLMLLLFSSSALIFVGFAGFTAHFNAGSGEVYINRSYCDSNHNPRLRSRDTLQRNQ